MSQILKLDLTDQQRNDLKSEFDNLKTIDEKLDFWDEKLKVDFCFFDQHEMSDIQDFWIEPTNEDDFEYINTRNLNSLKQGLELVQGKNAVISFEELEQDFLTKIETVKNKEPFIEEEITKLDKIFKKKEIELTQNPFSRSGFFIATYRKYYINDIEPVWNKKIYETRNLLESDRGLTTAKYKEFLEDYSKQLKTGIPKTPKYTHDQQILMLHYLGLYKDLDNIKKGILFGGIMNRDAETTRQRFSSLETKKTLKNLNLILSYFTELGFTDQIQIVEKDIISKTRKEEIKKGKRM